MTHRAKPIFQPGKATFTAIYGGEYTMSLEKIPDAPPLAILSNIRHGDIMIGIRHGDIVNGETRLIHYPKSLTSLNPPKGSTVQFVATVRPMPMNDGWYYNLVRLHKFSIVALPNVE